MDRLAWELLGVRVEFISFTYPSAWNGFANVTELSDSCPNAEIPSSGQAGRGWGGVMQVGFLQGHQVVPSPPALLIWHMAVCVAGTNHPIFPLLPFGITTGANPVTWFCNSQANMATSPARDTPGTVVQLLSSWCAELRC